MKRRDFIALIGGSAFALPIAAGAQQPVPVIGYLSTGSPESDDFRLIAFRQGLNQTGYVEGQNVAIEYRWAPAQYDRLPALAADLVRRQVTVIAAAGIPPTFAAKAATSTIPIAFLAGVDPVEFGLIASLNRPGGNITGVAILTAELAPKRLQLLHELAPTAAVIALLVNPTDPAVTESETRNLQDAVRSLGLQLHILPASMRDVQEAARVKGLQLPILKAGTESEIDAAFASLVEQQAGALVVGADPFFTERREQLATLASHHAVPAIYGVREHVAAGGLISYGASLTAVYRQLGTYAGKILKGAKPADLPVEQPTRFELVVDLKTAEALGLTIPHSMLMLADEVIE